MFPDPATTAAPLLCVRDLGVASRFWVEVMGGEVEVAWDFYVRLRLGAAVVHLVPAGPAAGDRPIGYAPPAHDAAEVPAEVVFRVPDCRAAHAALAARGAPLLGPPAEPPWGGEVRCYLRDPDGHLIEISEQRR